MRWSHTTQQHCALIFRSLLRQCARASAVRPGEQLHAAATVSGLLSSPSHFLLNPLLLPPLPRPQTIRPNSPLTQGLRRLHRPHPLLPSPRCPPLGDSNLVPQMHVGVVRFGFLRHTKVLNGVMDGYVKCGIVGPSVVSWTVVLEGIVKWEGVESGRVVFDEMPVRNEVGWTVMIKGYVGSGVYKGVTLCSVLSACSQSGDVSVGRWVHCYAVKAVGWDLGVMMGTCLADMYAKCGGISSALMVFRHMLRRNVVAWNAMLGGLAMHGMGKVLVEMFGSMVEEVKPDAVTFMALLSSCSHSGLVEQGLQYFHDLESVYGVRPEIEHYACMKMPIPPNEIVLGSLLGACYSHGKLRLGEKIMRELVQMDPLNTEYHILLSNMYALCGRVDKENSLRKVLKSRGIRKVPGMSSIYVDGQLHRFIAGDKSHPRTADIYMKLDDMICKLRLAGYGPNTNCQFLFGCPNGDDCMEAMEEVEQVLFTHSEKLALCFGLMSKPSGSPLYIFKNLRICQDWHSAIKIASDIYKREIVVRDRYRFHSFKQGSCSCSDYW
uniref:DYW domain-containing protein n=2 Tax=Glycine subgen. Soja TaxID=1462606 RepID=A0A0R0GJ22_SOYBN